MTKRKRSQRRADEREQEKLARDVDRLFALSPGGSPERPLRIDSPAEVEVVARGTRCPRCQGELDLKEHAAETIGKARLRVARLACTFCRAPRVLYFELSQSLLN
ncbi:MAG: hypothetical protein U0359_15645 [Byssovorax sp.]